MIRSGKSLFLKEVIFKRSEVGGINLTKTLPGRGNSMSKGQRQKSLAYLRIESERAVWLKYDK